MAPLLNQGDIAGLRRCLPELAAKVPAPCAGSSTSWAQAYLYAVAKMGGRGVAMGSDVNGAAALPGPRFGTFAAYGARNDASRAGERRREIDWQSNGVAYQNTIRDYRWYRFEPTGDDGYDRAECDIWQAIAQYEAGFNPATDSHPDDDFPELSLRQALDVLKAHISQNWVDHVTEGFWTADLHTEVSAEELSDWPDEKQAAYLARTGIRDERYTNDEDTWELVSKIRAIWAK